MSSCVCIYMNDTIIIYVTINAFIFIRRDIDWSLSIKLKCHLVYDHMCDHTRFHFYSMWCRWVVKHKIKDGILYICMIIYICDHTRLHLYSMLCRWVVKLQPINQSDIHVYTTSPYSAAV